MTIQIVDKPNMTPIGQDRETSLDAQNVQVSRIEFRGSRNKAFSNMQKLLKGFEETIHFSKEENSTAHT